MSRIIEFRKSAQKAERQSAQGKSCAFTGHRPQSLPFGFDESDKRCTSLKSVMRDQIVALIENEGVTHFITGMALGVDMYAAEIVLDLKSKYPHITLESAIPVSYTHLDVYKRQMFDRLIEWENEDNIFHRRMTRRETPSEVKARLLSKSQTGFSSPKGK